METTLTLRPSVRDTVSSSSVTMTSCARGLISTTEELMPGLQKPFPIFQRHVRRQLPLGGWFHGAMLSEVGGSANRRVVRLSAQDLSYNRMPEGGDKMSTTTLIIVILVVLLLFGGGFGYRRWRR